MGTRKLSHHFKVQSLNDDIFLFNTTNHIYAVHDY